MTISLDGRRFAAVTDVVAGEVGTGTVFTYHERAGEVWAEYAGGSIRRGCLVGTRDGDRLDFRYVQLNAEGQTSSGHCVTQVRILADAAWSCTSRGPGSPGRATAPAWCGRSPRPGRRSPTGRRRRR